MTQVDGLDYKIVEWDGINWKPCIEAFNDGLVRYSDYQLEIKVIGVSRAGHPSFTQWIRVPKGWSITQKSKNLYLSDAMVMLPPEVVQLLVDGEHYKNRLESVKRYTEMI